MASSVLAILAGHNAWANERIFSACGEIAAERLTDTGEGYDSVLGILDHLVQVENAFFELAHGRAPAWTPIDDLSELTATCARIDESYREYAALLDAGDGRHESFVVPWFGFEISREEGVLQALTHSHKHRADVSMLLPRLGGTGVEMDLIQWLDGSRGN